MNDQAKKRLEGLLQNLQEIEESSVRSPFIKCDVISSTLESPLRDPAAWKWIADLLQELRLQDNKKEGRTLAYVHPVAVEPFEHGKGCIRWYGNPDVRDKLKEWIVRLSGFFKSYSEVVPNSKPEYGLEGGLQALCAIATNVPELSPYIKRRRFLNLAAKTKAKVLPTKMVTLCGEFFIEKLEMPKRLEKFEPKPSFNVLEISESIPRLAMKVLNHLLGKPMRDPPIRVEFDESPKHEYAKVFVNGKPYIVEKVFALIVEQLVRANGNPISQRTITNNCPDLKKLKLPRFSRIFEKKQNKVPFEIEPNTKGFYLKPEWLQ